MIFVTPIKRSASGRREPFGLILTVDLPDAKSDHHRDPMNGQGRKQLMDELLPLFLSLRCVGTGCTVEAVSETEESTIRLQVFDQLADDCEFIQQGIRSQRSSCVVLFEFFSRCTVNCVPIAVSSESTLLGTQPPTSDIPIT